MTDETERDFFYKPPPRHIERLNSTQAYIEGWKAGRSILAAENERLREQLQQCVDASEKYRAADKKRIAELETDRERLYKQNGELLDQLNARYPDD